MKQYQGCEIKDSGTIDFIDIDLIVAEMQPDTELPTMVQIIHPESPEEQTPTVAQGTYLIPPDEQPLTAVQQTSPIPPDQQPTTVLQQIYPVQPASPVPPYKQLPKILQPASPLPEKSSHLEEIITNIKKKKSDDYFEKQFCQNLKLKPKRDLKSEKTEIVEHIKDCFS